jgi:pimeloyl-ACP methyl ester carboxylesterase
MFPRGIDSFLSEDVFLRIPENKSAQRGARDIILFIPGNPGLLGYYDDFLSSLSVFSPLKDFLIAGFSLGGFDVSASAHSEAIRGLQYPPDSPNGPIYGLRDQVDLTYRRVDALVSSLRQAESRNDGAVRVILIGHSVGAYIALEVIRRLHEERSKVVRGSNASSAYIVSGAILLTPTVIDIAKSSYGRIVTPLLTYAPFLDNMTQWAVWGLLKTLPSSTLEGLVGKLTGMRGEKLQTTLRWLSSERGVKQTIFMGGQEMREIGSDTWGEEVWGADGNIEGEVGEEGWRVPRLVLYFAQKDYWIDNATRDEIVKARGKMKEQEVEGKSWPRIEIEESGRLVHGWCIEQSKEVAEKAQKSIQEITGR